MSGSSWPSAQARFRVFEQRQLHLHLTCPVRLFRAGYQGESLDNKRILSRTNLEPGRVYNRRRHTPCRDRLLIRPAKLGASSSTKWPTLLLLERGGSLLFNVWIRRLLQNLPDTPNLNRALRTLVAFDYQRTQCERPEITSTYGVGRTNTDCATCPHTAHRVVARAEPGKLREALQVATIAVAKRRGWRP